MEMNNIFHEAQREKEAASQVVLLKEAVEILPPESKGCLQLLISYLRKISDNAQETLMHPENLGIIFGPTLFRSTSLDLDHIKLENTLVSTLIKSDIFTVDAKPTLRLVSPKGGQMLKSCHEERIEWLTTGEIGSVKVTMILDGDTTILAHHLPPNVKSLPFSVPIINSKDVTIIVSTQDDDSLSSSTMFSVCIDTKEVQRKEEVEKICLEVLEDVLHDSFRKISLSIIEYNLPRLLHDLLESEDPPTQQQIANEIYRYLTHEHILDYFKQRNDRSYLSLLHIAFGVLSGVPPDRLKPLIGSLSPHLIGDHRTDKKRSKELHQTGLRPITSRLSSSSMPPPRPPRPPCSPTSNPALMLSSLSSSPTLITSRPVNIKPPQFRSKLSYEDVLYGHPVSAPSTPSRSPLVRAVTNPFSSEVDSNTDDPLLSPKKTAPHTYELV
eukprot:TRINITY_DN4828_c0_g1_i2.p1 TRINITY_DN4828_c0_g1~~TRINITY_DN4828_c0_g1_i2.p1  ORF type:complete len:440 (+),score=103.24 TRINITY_DN4828_c0_g1_i2:1528-2847(+)